MVELLARANQPDPDPGSSKLILLLGLPRSRPRAGGGWARPLPSGRGGGWGHLAARNSEPVTWPTAERSPHKSPSPVDGGAVGGVRWAQWRTRCPSLFGRPAKRRRPHYLSSGVSADGVTPSAATGAAFEPLRSLQGFAVSGIPSGPASGLAGDRGDDLAGGTGPQRSAAQRREWTERQFVQRARSRAAGRKPDRDPRARDRAAAPSAAGEHRPCPVPARSALINNKKLGPKAPEVTQAPARPSNSLSRPPR